ncbi:hypothetical protein LINGRAHAP2_LOCUS17133 [Linum grandiflorum]
MVRVVG